MSKETGMATGKGNMSVDEVKAVCGSIETSRGRDSEQSPVFGKKGGGKKGGKKKKDEMY